MRFYCLTFTTSGGTPSCPNPVCVSPSSFQNILNLILCQCYYLNTIVMYRNQFSICFKCIARFCQHTTERILEASLPTWRDNIVMLLPMCLSTDWTLETRIQGATGKCMCSFGVRRLDWPLNTAKGFHRKGIWVNAVSFLPLGVLLTHKYFRLSNSKSGSQFQVVLR